MTNNTRTEITTHLKKRDYRPTVVCILYRMVNDEPKFLIEHYMNGSFSFVQGGINLDEDNGLIRPALRREIYEELRIPETDFRQKRGFYFTEFLDFEPEREDKQGFELGKVYYIILAEYLGDKKTFKLQEDEVAEAFWASKEEAVKLFSTVRKKKANILLDYLHKAYSKIMRESTY